VNLGEGPALLVAAAARQGSRTGLRTFVLLRGGQPLLDELEQQQATLWIICLLSSTPPDGFNSPDNLLLSSGTAPGPSRLSDSVPTRGVACRVA
jgi:hypothetical protein